MTKLQKSKKGFTLTELAIVIAVIAILIAVLVPTFVSLINKAQESSDSQLVKNLNTALSTEEAIDGKAETMSEALAVASENGYNVDKLTPASTGDIVWDQESNRFLLIDEKGSIVYSDSTTSSDVLSNKYQLWYIVESESDLNTTDYSQYLAYDASGATITTTTGSVDVGDNTNVTLEISGTAATSTSSSATGAALASLSVKKATATSTSSGLEFRVNSNGAKVTLKVSGDVIVYGTVSGNIVLESGKLTIAESAYVPAVYVTASTDNASEVSITNNSGNTIEVASSNITVTSLTGSDSTLSAVTVDSTATGYFAGGFGTEASPFTIETAAQFVKIGELSDEMKESTGYYYFKLTDNIDLTEVTSVNTSGYAISNVFHGQIDGNGKSIYVAGNTSVNDTDVVLFYCTIYDAVIENLTIIQTNSRLVGLFDLINVVADYRSKVGKVVLEDITFDSNYSGSEIQTFVYYGASQFCVRAMYKVDFINCVNKVSYKIPSSGTNGAYAGIFIGNYVDNTNYPSSVGDFSWGSTICFIGCENYGYVSGNSVGFFFGNSNQATASVQLVDDPYYENTNLTSAALYISDCANYGTLLGTAKVAPLGGLVSQTNNNTNNSTLLSDESKFIQGDLIVSNISDMSLSLNSNNKVIIAVSDNATIYSYTVTYGVSLSYSKNDTSYGSLYFSVSQTFTASNASTATTNYITSIMMDTTYDTTADTGSKYADLATNGTLKSDHGIEYILVANNDGSYTAVISSSSAVSIYTNTTGITASCGSTPGYIIYCNNSSNRCIGLVSYSKDELAATSSTNAN